VTETLRGKKEAEAFSRILEYFIRQTQVLLPSIEIE